MRVKWCMLTSLLMIALVAAGCAPTKAPAGGGVPAGYQMIRMVGTTLGGRGATVPVVLANVLNKYYPEIEWSSTSGSAGTNTVYVTKGSVKLATGMASHYIAAYGFDAIPQSRVRSFYIYGPLLHYIFVIPEDKPWKDIAEVPKGASLCPGSPGSTTIPAAEAWLGLAGLSKKDFNWIPLGKNELTDAWRSGKVDLAFFTIGGPSPDVTDMYNSTRRLKAMGLTSQQAAKAKAELTFERMGFEPVTMGNLTEIAPDFFKYDVLSPKQASYLLGRDDFPEDIAYRMARVLDEHNAEVTQMYSALKWATPPYHIQWARPPVAIHSGVAKYYKEKGYLK